MNEFLAAVLVGLIVYAVLSPEEVGGWLKRIDEARFVEVIQK